MGDTDYIKIGITGDSVHRRIAELQTGNPLPLHAVLEKTVEDARLAEIIVHDRYWLLREMGEWFYLDPEKITLQEVESYIRNDLDVDIAKKLGLVNDFLQCPYCGNTVVNKLMYDKITKRGYCSRCNPRNKYHNVVYGHSDDHWNNIVIHEDTKENDTRTE
jgi:hypothetical protein